MATETLTVTTTAATKAGERVTFPYSNGQPAGTYSASGSVLKVGGVALNIGYGVSFDRDGVVLTPAASCEIPAGVLALTVTNTASEPVDVVTINGVSRQAGEWIGGAYLRSYTIAGNRFQFPRRQSAAAVGFNMFTDRWHKSPSVPLDNLRAVWFAGYQHQSNGLQPIGNDLTVSCAVMYPVANAPGAAKAFKKDGAAQITVKDGSWIISDPLSVYLPENTPFRLRSWVSPGANGFIPYGMPGMAQSSGHLANFPAGATDRSAYASAQADETQSSVNVAGNGSNDSMFEPFIIGMASQYVPTYALFGDSLTYGANEVGFGGGATVASAGDGWGNVGWWARAMALKGYEYSNFGISGSQLRTWATDGYSSMIFDIASMCCNRAVIALGTNDALGQTSATILADLQRMVNKARVWADKVVVATLPPRTSGTFTDLAGQTVDASRTPVINAVNTALRNGQITGATVIDINAMVRDPVQTDKWRVDGGQWTSDGTHYEVRVSPIVAAQIAAALP